MKRLQITSLVCGGILSISSSALLAQSSSSSSSTSPTSSSSQLPSSSSQSSSLGQSSSSSSLGSSSSSLGSSSSMSSGQNVRLSHIMNTTVQGQDGKTLGYIRDLVVDPQSGRVEFAVLSLSNAGAASDTSTSGRETVPSSRSSASGIPSSSTGSSTTGKLIPVPWQLFSQSWTGTGSASAGGSSSSSSSLSSSSGMGHPLVLNIDESKLRSAPSFDASNWNEMHGGTFGQRVYSYFGVDRSSAVGTSGSSISGQGTSGTYDHSSHGNSSSSGSSTTSPNSSSSGSSSTQPDK
jgi:sporulation protein YlmC with PRC-barrel domain